LNKSVVDESQLHKNKSKFLKARTTSGHKSAIEEILSSPDIMSRLTDVKVMDEVRILRQFTSMLDNDPNRTCYGIKEVLNANEQIAIESLLISDKMYRSDNYEERNRYVELIDSVKHSGGKVYKFSSLHVSGEQLNNFTGIAAILRFPLYDEETTEAETNMKG
jgi:protein pelota